MLGALLVKSELEIEGKYADILLIPKEKIEGIVVYRFWPLNVWGKIN